MQIIRTAAHARAGLVGNPSDGYGGKTLSFIVPEFRAQVVLYEWEDVEIVQSRDDQSRFGSINELARDVELHGYYGGIRLIKAALKRFVEFCRDRYPLHDRNFAIRYESNIPRLVGLAGSSAIIVATLRALMQFYEIEIPKVVLPSLALSVETQELGIAAGLQDRVIQVYEGIVYMDFSPTASHLEYGLSCGSYESLSLTQWPPLYISFADDTSEPTERLHNDLKSRFHRGDTEVVNAMLEFADLAEQAKTAVMNGHVSRLGELIDANFDLRARICPLSEKHLAMVQAARSAGATAKFAGSGGAIVGTCPTDAWPSLNQAMDKLGCRVVRPAPAVDHR